VNDPLVPKVVAQCESGEPTHHTGEVHGVNPEITRDFSARAFASGGFA
jgi:hypothetical protein